MFTASKNANPRKSLRIENQKNNADERKRQNSSRNDYTEEPPQKRNEKDDAGRKRQNSSRTQSPEVSSRKRMKIHGKKDTQKPQIRK